MARCPLTLNILDLRADAAVKIFGIETTLPLSIPNHVRHCIYLNVQDTRSNLSCMEGLLYGCLVQKISQFSNHE